MKLFGTKNEPENVLHTVTDALDEHKGPLVKAALIAGGVAALTAGSAAISSLRRRREGRS